MKKHLAAEQVLSIVLVVTGAIVVVAMVWLIAGKESLTPLEGLLSSIMLTVFSILASVHITRLYSKVSSDQFFRDRGVQIASDVMVLSRRIEALGEWVQNKRCVFNEEQCSKSEIDAAMEHVEETLDGFTEWTRVALKGIAGVIGDALEQYESVMTQVSDLRSEEERKRTALQRAMHRAPSEEALADIHEKLEELQFDTERKIKQLVFRSPLPIPDVPKDRRFVGECPYCQSSNEVVMPNSAGETRAPVCVNCGESFNAHVAANGRFFTRPRGTPRHSTFVPESDFQQKIYSVLRTAQLWSEPETLYSAIDVLIRVDKELAESGEEKTPYLLQQQAVQDGTLLAAADINPGRIRVVCRHLFLGGAFACGDEKTPTWRSAYDSNLSEAAALKAYLRSVVTKLRMEIPDLDAEDTAELGQMLLGEQLADSLDLVESALGTTVVDVPMTTEPEDPMDSPG